MGGSLILSASSQSDSAGATLSGTSMACPHVSGVAAMALSRDPSLNALQVTELILNQALVGRVKDAGQGSPNKLLFMGGLSQELAPTQEPTTAPTVAPTPVPTRAPTSPATQAPQTPAPPPPTQPPTPPPSSPPTAGSPAQIRFVAEISQGRCSDFGGLPINDKGLCELAAAVLGVPDRTASATNRRNRPEGCYVFRGNRLVMGVNPASKGNGAETSTPRRSRHPICGFTE